MHYLPIGNAEDWLASLRIIRPWIPSAIGLFTSQHGLVKD